MRTGVLYALVSTAYATNTQQCKSDDKCIRALHESCKSATAKTFCASYLHTKTPPTATKGLPSWLDNCGLKDKISRISSACSCYLTTSSKFSTSTKTTTSSPRPTTSSKSSSKYPTSSRPSLRHRLLDHLPPKYLLPQHRQHVHHLLHHQQVPGLAQHVQQA